MKLIQGDCLKEMDKLIEQGVKVDAVITDPPYGTTACKWDSVIPFDQMWERLNQLIKPNGAIVLFGSEPFSSSLRMSNLKNYKYDWTWNKVQGTGFSACKKQPLRVIENISVFYNKPPLYNPQMVKRDKVIDSSNWKQDKLISENSRFTGKDCSLAQKVYTEKYPVNYIEINRAKKECNNTKRVHPTQKPVALMEYLIKTYTNENETVLDFTMGSGSTGVACVNTNRNFIGIELDKNYFEIAKNRIESTTSIFV